MSYALGLLETYGYTTAIVGLDTALKSANVMLKDFEKIGGGLVTIMVEGDVAAVTASIEAAGESAKTIGLVVSQHVIPRVDDKTQLLFKRYEGNNQGVVEENISSNLVDKFEEEKTKAIEVPKKETTESTGSKKRDLVLQHNGKEIKITSKKELHRMKVVELRKIARSLDGFSIEAKKIKFANKSELVNAIVAYMKMEVE